jgi:hypothetical protein
LKEENRDIHIIWGIYRVRFLGLPSASPSLGSKLPNGLSENERYPKMLLSMQKTIITVANINFEIWKCVEF